MKNLKTSFTFIIICFLILLSCVFKTYVFADNNCFLKKVNLVKDPNKLIAEEMSNNIEWSLDNNGTLTIAGIGDIPDYSYPYAPWYQYRDSIKSIVIEDTITSIGDQAFICCTNLVSIEFGNSITSIGEGAFYECSSIETIFIPNTVTSIGDGAFCECTNLTHIVLPNTITYIGEEAFEDCPNITVYVYDNSYAKEYCIDNNINYIIIETDFVLDGITITPPTKLEYEYNDDLDLTGLEVFQVFKSNNHSILVRLNDEYSVNGYNKTQSGIQTITVSYVNYIDTFSVNISHGRRLDYGTAQNINWTLYQDGSLLIEGDGDMPNWYKSVPWNQYKESINSVEIINGITSISGNVFSYYSNLTSITIPDSVTSIGVSAFKNCSNLMSINIPEGVTKIYEYTFYGCSSLSTINIPENITFIGREAFRGCSSLMSSISIPQGIVSICDRVFEDCSSLTSITIPDSVISIGISAFQNCSNLTSINIPEGITSIGESAFSGCLSLTSISIPDSVTEIKNYAFNGCSSLTSIDLSNSITLVGNSAFENCSSLTSISIPDSVTLIGKNAFNGCSNLTSITIPDSVTFIGNYAFSNCSNLVSLIMPISARIDEYSFDGVTNLTSIILTKGTGVGINYNSSTYQNTPWYTNKDKLTNLTLEKGITSIGACTFRDSEFSTITIPHSVTTIDAHSFAGCDSLTTIIIPDSVTYIGGYAFNGCSSLASINIPEGITSISYSSFKDCSSLTSATIGDSVTSIGAYAFYGCLNLTSITIPDSVTSIGNYAFFGCSNLTSITIPDSVTSIGTDAFSGCSSDLLLCGYESTYLQEYCLDNGLTYQELSKISNKTMSGTLKNNGTVSLTLNVEVDDWIDLDNAYALINGKKVSLDSIDTNGRVSIVTPGVAPKNINDDFVIRYYDENDNPISKEINLSVKEYIETLLNGYLNKKTKTFYKSLLNYASYAQEYFDYNTDNLANDSLDELDKDVSDVTHDDLTAYSASKAGLTEGISAYGQTLVLNNEVDYRIYFLLDGTHSIDEYIFKDGNNTLNKFKYSNSLYYVIIPKMAAPDLDKSHTVTVTLNGEGNLSITSSVLTYVEITLKDEPISQKDIQLANLMKALYKYSISAKNLLGA